MSEFYPKTADDDSPALDECSAVLEGHEPGESIHALALSREFGKLFSAGGDCTVRVWQVRWNETRSMSSLPCTAAAGLAGSIGILSVCDVIHST